jgi:hypothetical protein
VRLSLDERHLFEIQCSSNCFSVRRGLLLSTSPKKVVGRTGHSGAKHHGLQEIPTSAFV